MSTIQIRNPYSNEILNELTHTCDADVATALDSAHQAFQVWRHSTAWQRSEFLRLLALQLESEKEQFAELICSESGKPISLARGETDRALNVLRWAAAEAQRFSGELIRLDAHAPGRTGFGIHNRFPRGVVLGITPYNFPLNLVVHKLAPAIASGCSILIKPSLFAPLTALRLVDLINRVQAANALNIPKDLVQVILPSDQATAQLTQHPKVATLSFTGSAKVGWAIRRQAPEKPTTLELGGNAWVIVAEDTPSDQLPGIALKIASAAYGYAGQTCISVQNVAVSQKHWPEFQTLLRDATLSTTSGNPALPSITCGPLIHLQAANRIRKLLTQLPVGCELVAKNGSSGDPDTLVQPSLILSNRACDDRESLNNELTQEEIFGPVMLARPYSDLSAAISAVNSGRYGLQAGVFTQNWPTMQQLYRDLDVGGLMVNEVPSTRYDQQPYGGVKESGAGREGIIYAMQEMTESKFLALHS